MKFFSNIKEYARYVSCNVLGMIGLSCYILADTFFVAQGLGTDGLTALNLAIPVYSFVHGCGLMLGMGGASKFSIYQSAGKQKQSNIIFTNTIWIAVGLMVIFVVLGLFGSQVITTALGADKTVFGMTNIYLKVILLFSPAFLINDILICFIRNDKNPRISMLAMLGGSFSNILLDYLFIFPFNMGIFGAVLATGLAPIISILILSPHWMGKKKGFHIISQRINVKNMYSVLLLGFPAFVTEVSSGIVIIVFNMILLDLQGNIGVAAYGIVANLALVVTAVYTGIAQGMQPLVSREYGGKNTMRVKQILRYAVITVLGISCVVYCLIFFFADPIAEIFNSTKDPNLQQIAVQGLKLYFTACFLIGANIVLATYFASIEKPRPAHIISLLRGLILIIPMAYYLSWQFEILGTWLAVPMTEFCVAVIALLLYRRSNLL